jgi:hypothetical protein
MVPEQEDEVKERDTGYKGTERTREAGASAEGGGGSGGGGGRAGPPRTLGRPPRAPSLHYAVRRTI